MLCGLIGHRHTGLRRELAGPHARAVDDVLALDVTLLGAHADDPAILDEYVEYGGAFEDGHALHARTLGECHRRVDGIHAAVLRHVEAGEQVVRAGRREEIGHLAGRDLVHLGAAESIESRHASVFLEPALVCGDLDEADGREAGRLPGLSLQPGVEVARVVAHASRGFGEGTERHHEARRVPGRARGEPVALEQDRLGTPAHMPEVVSHRGSDDPPADDDDAGSGGQIRC